MDQQRAPSIRPRRGDELELEVSALANGGAGIARLEGYVVFVEGGFPGDLVRARVHQRKRSYAQARATALLEPGLDQVAALADHPGAPWQVLRYERQLEVKQAQVEEAEGLREQFESEFSRARVALQSVASRP